VKDSARLMRLTSSTLHAFSQIQWHARSMVPTAGVEKLRVQTHRGVHRASFEALVGISPVPVYGNAMEESYVFTVLVVHERLGGG
jgi:hypothetical protein